MKLSWVFVILLLVFVAVFSVQNAAVITVKFLVWEISMSAALVIQLAALLGALVGIAVGTWSRRSSRSTPTLGPERPQPVSPSPSTLDKPAA